MLENVHSSFGHKIQLDSSTQQTTMTIRTYIFTANTSHHEVTDDDEDDDMSIMSANGCADLNEPMVGVNASLSFPADKNNSSDKKGQASINRWDSSSFDIFHESCCSLNTSLHARSSHLPQPQLPPISLRSKFTRRVSGLSGYTGTADKLSTSSGLSSLPRSKDSLNTSLNRGYSLRSLTTHNRPKNSTNSSSPRSIQSRLSQSQHSHCSRQSSLTSRAEASSINTSSNHSRCTTCPPQLPQRNRSFDKGQRIALPSN